MIEDSLSGRKHVIHYDPDIIPSQDEIKEILKIGYSLSTSKQKAFPYKFHVLGPNKDRSKKLWNMAEGRKIVVDYDAYGTHPDSEKYNSNPGLYHLKSAPYTFIITPRITSANKHYEWHFQETGSKWQLDDWEFLNTKNRESCAIEIGMCAKAITGAALDRGWDVSYNVCFSNDRKQWRFLPYLDFRPVLMMTLGKGKTYFYERLSSDGTFKNDPKFNTSPPFDDIFQFVDHE